MKNIIILYHANCTDGFGAAYAAWKELGDTAEYIAVQYGQLLPDLADKDVYMLDFSVKPSVIEAVVKVVKRLTIIDHHKTAQADIEPMIDGGLINGIFDMNKSGAMIAWELFHGEESAPTLFKHIQDYDLWRFEYSNTRAVIAGLRSYEMNFKDWDIFCSHGSHISKFESEGEAILRNHMQNVKLLSQKTQRISLCGHDVPCVNANGFMASDLGHILSKDELFSATYYINSGGEQVFSLRSSEGGMDVSRIAKAMGGGGHQHAAGFVSRAPMNFI